MSPEKTTGIEAEKFKDAFNCFRLDYLVIYKQGLGYIIKEKCKVYKPKRRSCAPERSQC